MKKFKLKNLLKVFILSLFVVVAFNSCDKGDDPQPKETAYLVVKVNTVDSNVGILKSNNLELDSIYCKQFDENGDLIESAESDFNLHIEGGDTIYIIKTSQNPKAKRVEIHNESGDTTDNVYNIVVKEGDLIYSTNTDFYKGSELPNSIEVRNLRTEEYGLNADGDTIYRCEYYEQISLPISNFESANDENANDTVFKNVKVIKYKNDTKLYNDNITQVFEEGSLTFEYFSQFIEDIVVVEDYKHYFNYKEGYAYFYETFHFKDSISYTNYEEKYGVTPSNYSKNPKFYSDRKTQNDEVIKGYKDQITKRIKATTLE